MLIRLLCAGIYSVLQCIGFLQFPLCAIKPIAVLLAGCSLDIRILQEKVSQIY